MKTKKSVKGKAKAKPGSSKETVLLEDGEDAWSIPSSDEGKPAAAKAQKADKGDRDAATAARKAGRARAAAWRVQTAQASRSIACLNSACASIKNLMDKADKNSGLINDDMMKSLKEANLQMTDFRDRTLVMI